MASYNGFQESKKKNYDKSPRKGGNESNLIRHRDHWPCRTVVASTGCIFGGKLLARWNAIITVICVVKNLLPAVCGSDDGALL